MRKGDVMRKGIAILLLAALLAPATHAEVTADGAIYLGGTLTNLKQGAAGTLNLTSPEAIVFAAGSERLAIPYTGIQSYEYSRKLARHIGVIATIVVVAIVKHRQRRHFVTISYKDAQGTPQLAVFEISKEMPQILFPVLQARAPRSSSKVNTQHEHLLFH